MNSENTLRTELQRLVKLALPVILNQVGLVMLNIVDIMIAGRASAEATAGVGAGANIFWPVNIIGAGFIITIETFVSQARGAGDETKVRKLMIQGLWLVALISIPLTLVLITITHYYHLFGPSADVLAQAKPYLETIAWALPATLLFSFFHRYWQSREVVYPIVGIIVLSNLINLLVDYALILGNWGFPALGAKGAALATVFTTYFMLTFIIVLTFVKNRSHLKKKALTWKTFSIDWTIQKDLIRLGFPASTQFALEVGAFSIASILAAGLGAIPMAAHQTVLSIASFTFMFPFGFSSATAVRVGTLIGSRKPEQARRVGWLALFMTICFMGTSCLILLLFPHSILSIFTTDLDVIEIGIKILFLGALFQVSDGIQVVATGALRGLGNTRTSMFANLIGHYPCGLLLGAFLCFQWELGALGIWIGLATGLSVVAILLIFAWKKLSKQTLPSRELA